MPRSTVSDGGCAPALVPCLQIDRDKEDKARVAAELKVKRDEFGRVLAALNAQREVSR